MSVSKVHHCISQEYVAQGIEEPGWKAPGKPCRCRKYVSLQEATHMVKIGEARWVVTKRTREASTERCSLCNGNQEVKKCANCYGLGHMPSTAIFDEYINDIVRVSRAAVDKKTERKYRPALAMKTPRVATIESEHIELAYVEGIPEAAERIEEYGKLILDARVYRGKAHEGHSKYPFGECPCESVIKMEPEDNKENGTGRRYDYGRAVFSRFNPSIADPQNKNWQLSVGLSMIPRSDNHD